MTRFGRGKQRTSRAFLALAAILAPAGSLLAQTAPTNDSAPVDTIGPGELRNFSLGSRPAPAPAETVEPDLITSPRTARTRAARPAAPAADRTPASRPRATTTVVPPPAPVPLPTVAATVPPPQPVQRPTSSVTVALPQVDPLSRRPTPAGEADVPRLSSQPMGVTPPDDAYAPDEGWSGILPWLLGLMLVGGAALAYAFRDRLSGAPRPEPALAGGPLVLPRELPARSFPPAPPPAPRIGEPTGGITVKRPNAFAPPPTAAPPPAPASPTGIISTRLRPWLELSFEPSRAVIDEAQAHVQFDVVVTNSGNAPARQVLVEACMVNAGPEQDAELRRFFDSPVGVGDRIEAIPPLGKIQLKSAVSLPLDQVRAYEVGGRKLFVPLVAFNALYAWGSSSGQSSAAFILGRGTSAADGEGDARMAPLRLDLGPRIFRELDSRRHSLGLRR